MSLAQQFAAADIEVSRRTYDDAVVFAADFGPAADATVDVVGDTVIVVAGDDQYEFDVDAGAEAEAFVQNGVLTVEVRA